MNTALKRIPMIDHFCGAGGESTGLIQATDEAGIKVELHACNHWKMALDTHKLNHPEAHHYESDILELKPEECDIPRRVALMWGSPACTHHSNAAGGIPRDDQSRALADALLPWAEFYDISRIIVENVPEFMHWGPLGKRGRPLKNGKGRLFRAWVRKFEAMGYTVEYRILCLADYGDPTTRRRLFVQMVKNDAKMLWPAKTHSDKGWEGLPRWRAAREVIDFSLPTQSIFHRKRPLAKATIRRIKHGIKRYWGTMAPYYIARINQYELRRENASIYGVLPKVMVQVPNTEPAPFINILRGTGTSRNIDRPVPAVTAGGTQLSITQPLFVPRHSAGTVKPIQEPVPTVTTTDAIGVVQPLIPATGQTSSNRIRPAEQPLSTIVTKAEHCIVEPFLSKFHGGNPDRNRTLDKPVPTVDCANRIGLVSPLLVEYYGNGTLQPVDNPVPTVTCKERFGVLQGTAASYMELDIMFRMMQPKELALAQGFPAEYKFLGNKAQQVRQIGNAVPPGVARQWMKKIIEEEYV